MKTRSPFLRIAALAASVLLCLGAVGCGGKTPNDSTPNSSGADTSASTSPDISAPSGSDASLPTGTDTADPTQTGTGKTDKTTGSANNKTTSGGSAAPTKVNGIDLPGTSFDLKGRTVNIGIWYGFQSGDGTDDTYVRQKKINDAIEKKYNCKLNFVDTKSGADEQLKASILSGKPKVDFFGVQGNTTFYNLYSAGCLTPLSSIKTLDISDTTHFLTSDMTVFGGKQYAVTQRPYGWLSRNFNNILLCNFKLTGQAGYTADTIYGWQEKGEWTWDKMEEVMAAVAKISGKYGMSDLDQNDMYGFSLDMLLYQSMLYANGTDWVKKSGNTFQFNGDSAPAMAALNKYTSWVKKGYVKYAKEAYEDFKSGKTAFLGNIYPGPIIANWMCGDNKEVGVLYFPKGPSADKYVSLSYEAMYVVMSKGVQNPTAIGALMYDFCSPLYTQEESRSLCRRDVMKISNNKSSLDTMMKIFDDEGASKTPVGLYGTAAGLALSDDTAKPGWLDYVQKIAQNEMTADQAVKTFKSRCNSVMSSIYD